MEKVNQTYISLAKRFGINISITITDDPQLPCQEILELPDGYVIQLNPGKFIPDLSYESYVAYNTRKILLPNLILETDRLCLRRLTYADAQDCFSFLSDQEGMYLDCCKAFSSMDDEYFERIALFAKRDSQYAVTLKSNGKVIGTVNVFEDNSRVVDAWEIGYAISPAYQRNGYAYEILSALIDLLQNKLQLELITAGTLKENYASIKLLHKLGFTHEGTRHKAIWHEALNRPVDLEYFYLDKT